MGVAVAVVVVVVVVDCGLLVVGVGCWLFCCLSFDVCWLLVVARVARQRRTHAPAPKRRGILASFSARACTKSLTTKKLAEQLAKLHLNEGFWDSHFNKTLRLAMFFCMLQLKKLTFTVFSNCSQTIRFNENAANRWFFQ